jgi:Ca2+-binding RTX toxin-like protein
MTGGRGRDTASYATHTTGVSASVDGRTNDGSPGEGDSIANDLEQVTGSPANDVLRVRSSNRTLVGGAGNDVLLGGTGADSIQGGDGDDRVDGNSGADVLDGGAGRDTLDYSTRFLGVTADLAAHTAVTLGESDRVLGFEDVIGSRRDDRLRGDAGPNRLSGGGGNDALDGRLGPDVLIGGRGFDTAIYSGRPEPLTVTLEGRAGDGARGEGDNVTSSVEGVTGGRAGDVLIGSSRANSLRGGNGRDRLVGGGGPDLLIGGLGRDRAEGGRGRDDLFMRDRSADAVLCGRGEDTAVVDRRDRLGGCEHATPRRKR